MGDSGKGLHKGETEGATFFNVRLDNFAIGSAWGLISGISSGLFTAPVPDKFLPFKYLGYFKRFRFLKFMKNHDVMYPSFVLGRAIRRSVLAGLVFDQSEQATAKYFGFGHSTTSGLVGLTLLSIFFRVSTDIRHTIIASSTILGGYAIGSQLAKLVHSMKNGDSSNSSGSGKRDE